MPAPAARPWNFSAGPAILPLEVMERAAEAVKRLDLPGDAALESRLSVLEISHRSKSFDAVHESAIARLQRVLELPRSHRVLFLQGGATLQFAMVPMNLRQEGKPAAYVDTGVWSEKAIKESRLLGPTEVLASSASSRYDHIPAFPEPRAYAGASYVHITSNNTIYGTEYDELPRTEGGVPLISDVSSHIGSRPMDYGRLGLAYAGAQKNLGPSGLTVVIVEESLLERAPASPVPHILRYKSFADTNSLLNTPSTFGILVLDLVLEWMEKQGGLAAIGEVNRRKAEKLYAVLDGSDLFEPHARVGSRSRMNVTWRMRGKDDAEVESRTKRFLQASLDAGMTGLKGHRLVGGFRASIYNAFPEAGVDALCELMREFERTGG